MKNVKHRIDVIVTAEEKSRITNVAKDAGISTGELMRRAAAAYCIPETGAMLDEMLYLLNESTLRASAAIDNALASIEASNRRIAQMEHGTYRPLVHEGESGRTCPSTGYP